MEGNKFFVIKLSTLMMIFLYHLVFVEISYIKNYKIITFILMIFLGLYLFKNLKIFLNKQFLIRNIWIYLFCISIIITAFYNDGISQLFYRTLFYVCCIIELFLLLELFSLKKILINAIRIFYYLTLFYIVLNDIILLFIPNLYHTLGNGEFYLIGNKFSVGYFHITLFILSFYLDLIKKQKISWHSFLFLLLSAIISSRIGCSTTLIGSIILMIFVLIPLKVKKFLKKRTLLFITLIVSTFILLVFSSILQYGPIKYIIENILGEDVGLTGRLNIYNNLSNIIQENLWLGYGHGESYNVLFPKIWAPNAQNGVLDCVIQYGLVGTGLYIKMIFSMFKSQKKDLRVYPFVILTYMYIILSSVEITLNITFLISLAIINAMYFKDYIFSENNI